ncbi:MAG TPA: alpha-glucuronidase family glycosyl hydrolase [Steroidobacteraceae bacterium]|nr:alpha-glucuronidase family glycosyl hydrolase [Steroidobacteraceae bacterium]
MAKWRIRIRALLGALALLAVQGAWAEDGYDLWLRYVPVQGQELAAYRARASGIALAGSSATLHAACAELVRGLAGLLGQAVPVGTNTGRDGTIVLGTPASSPEIAALRLDLTGLGPEGYLIRSVTIGGHPATVIAANEDIGVLYGTFHLLRLIQTHRPLQNLDIASAPRIRNRVLDHWDNLDRTVERGYAGESIWDWHKLPDYVDPRYTDYARASASVGINGAVLNNVNANATSLQPAYIAKTAAIAKALRPYGIHVYLSARFSAPIEIGGLKTADPLDASVRAWWRAKADEIYRAIPDFGGFLVKANSEGQPGPQDYHRTHADGANMLAEAVAPHGGIVMWRAFVYSNEQPDDRAKQAYSEFVPLDGKFRQNVLLQVKNGPIDFQPREPFHPLFGAMPKTPLMLEVQLTKEYLGFATHLVYLAPLYEETLQSDTYAKRKGSTVAKVIDGSLHGYTRTGMAGVANIGTDRNWTGSQFDQANWYAFGRLAWDPSLSSERIADEWVRMTFTNDPAFVKPVVAMMMGSREAAVNYMTPLGLHHIMGRSYHYGPGPWVSGGQRADWTSVYYHRADANGIGFDRSPTGSNATAQYAPEVAAVFADRERVPEKFLLWFHHVPWDYKLKSGRTLWDELVLHYTAGVETVATMRKTWAEVGKLIDPERRDQIAQFLAIQEKEAKWWRDACIAYFQSFSHRPLPAGVAPPEHTLAEYEAIRIPYAPGLPPANPGLKPTEDWVVTKETPAPTKPPTFVAASTSSRVSSRPFLSAIFQDHAVLQREQPIRIWGWANPDDEVDVSLATAKASARAGSDGRWSVTLPALQAGGPYALEVSSSSGAHQTLGDILIGDVWLCSGQSNMVLEVKRTLNSRSEILNSANNRIRVVTLQLENSLTPLDNLKTTVPWQIAGPDTAAEFSATCFYFARELQKTVDVPMGLVVSAWGGSNIQTWMSANALHTVGGFDASLDLLKLRAKDPAAATAQWGRMWQDWWKAHTKTAPGAEPWSAKSGVAQSWRVAPKQLGFWEDWGVPELAEYNGIVWYRTTFTLTAKQAAQRATVSLGPIDEVDETWVNGIPVGYTSGPGTDREYDLSAAKLHAGENTIAIAALDTYATGGLYGPAERRAIHFADGTSIPLDREWRYRIAPPGMGPEPRAPWEPTGGLTTIYNAMIAPLVPYTFRGVVWYQGESNTNAPDNYEQLLAGLMADWRAQFGAADLPFLVVQLAGYGEASTKPTESGTARVREAQRLAVAHDAHAGLAVAVDIGERSDIHPANKQEVGRRLARAARHVVYGETSLPPSGPVPLSARLAGDRVVVTFGDTEGKLIAYGAARPVGFELCAQEQVTCRFVDARIEGDSVSLQPAPGITPTRVRYCWADSPVCTLYDEKNGLPAGPFEMAIQ